MADGVQLNPYVGVSALAADVGNSGGKVLNVTSGGQNYFSVPAANGNTTIKVGPGVLCKIIPLVTGSGIFTIYDNATGITGTVLYKSIASQTVGTPISLDIRFTNGCTIDMPASTPQLLVTYI